RAVAPAIVQTSVLPDAPAQLLQRLGESSHAILSFSIMSGEWGEHTNATHALALLRARRERPRRGGAEQRDEIPPVHRAILPVLPTGRIAHLGTAGDCRAAAFRFDSCRLRVRLGPSAMSAQCPVCESGRRSALSRCRTSATNALGPRMPQ